MKQQLIRIMAYILTVSIMLTSMPTISAAAATEESYVRTSVTTLKANTGKQWKQAVADITLLGKTWSPGYFHNQVQSEIRANNKGFLNKELRVYYKDANGNPTGEWGSADLSMEKRPYTYIWEVKPVHYGLNPKLEQETLEDQLDGYIATESAVYRRGSESGVTIEMATFKSKEGKYYITYQDAGNGLILYRFDRIKENDDDDEQDNFYASGKKSDDDSDSGSDEEKKPDVTPFPDNLPEADRVAATRLVEYLIGGVIIGGISATTLVVLERYTSLKPSIIVKSIIAGELSVIDALFIIQPAFAEEEYEKLIKYLYGDDDDYWDDDNEGGCPDDDEEGGCRRPWWDPRCWFRCTCKPLPPVPPDPSNEIEDDLNKARNTVSPIVIDLTGNGIDTISLHNGVFFDHRGNGFLIKTGWTGPDSGLLVRDIDGNGTIDNGRELFGNHTLLKNGTEATNGFEALKDLDSNGDGIIDAQDTIWCELGIWIDANSSAIADKGELFTLEEVGIVSIHLNYKNIYLIDAQGNTHRQISTVTMSDGRIADAVDVWFARAASDSVATSNLPVSDEVSVLPDIRGYGTTYSLHQTMMRKNDGKLQTLLEKFAAEQNESKRLQITKEILYAWSGTNTNLAALEAFGGIKYTGGTGPNATAVLNKAFDKFAKSIHDNLMAQTHLKQLYDLMKPALLNDTPVYNLKDAGYEILDALSIDQTQGESLLMDFVTNIYNITLLEWVDLDSLRNILEHKNPRYGFIIDMVYKNIIHNTVTGNILKGTNSDTAFWLDGGDNYIESGSGNDTFFFNQSLGTNTIMNGGGNNTLLFSGDVAPENVIINQVFTSGNLKDFKLEITITGMSGKITIEKFNYSSSYSIIFADGSVRDITDFIVPIEIHTAEQLKAISNNLMGYYCVMSDIDLDGMEWTPIGTNRTPFSGMLDGNGYTIKNLMINLPSTDYIGLFGYNNGTIRNLTFEHANVTGRNNTGGLAGHNGGIISDCIIKGSVDIKGGPYTGGVSGWNTGMITNCSLVGDSAISGTGRYHGGLVGYNSGGKITKSFSTANVMGYDTIGGFVGYSQSGLIEECYATGNISPTSNTAGGFIGSMGGNATIKNCFSTGNVLQMGTTAGFVGSITSAAGKVENCYATATNANGFNFNGTVTNCYFNSDLSSSTKSEGRNTVQMSEESTYEGWDFENVWTLEENAEYPTLRGLAEPNIEFFEIRTVEDFNAIRNNLIGNYRLMNDIDLEGVEWTPIGTLNAPYTGIFDGNNYTIKNLDINTTDNYIGVFGNNSGVIRNITLKEIEIKGGRYIGGLSGNNNGTIRNATLENAAVTGGNYTGGLSGWNAGVVINCSVTGNSTVNNTGTNTTHGGLVGCNNGGRITKSFSTANITGYGTIGGLVGCSQSGLIEECYAVGNVSSTSSIAGGFVGSLSGTANIKNCFSIGKVIQSSTTAGFVGNISGSTVRVENCFSTATNANGFSFNGAVTNCFFNSDLSISTKSEGRTFAQMTQKSTFKNWDFENVWMIEEGDNYPTLKELVKPSDSMIEISTAEELDAIRDNLFGHYRLTADIDLNGIEWTPIGTSTTPFSGMFDGNGHTISNLTVNLPAVDRVGLFGYNNGRIQNITIENASVTGRNYTGILAGINANGYIHNCTILLTEVTGTSYVGGIAGGNDATITSCAVTTGETEIKATSYTGGFTGYNNGTIIGCSVTGKAVIKSTSGYVGGFVGYNNKGTITKSYSTLHVFGTLNSGGFAGITHGLVEECYSTGNVTSTGTNVGGFVGSVGVANAIVRECYSLGNVSSTSISAGGFAGNVTGKVENCHTESSHFNGLNGSGSGTITNSYFNSNLSPSKKEQGRTTAELIKMETYEGWDFKNVWTLEDGDKYPTLKELSKPSSGIIEISTAEELDAIRNNLFGHYRLMADINLDGIEWTPIGTNTAPFSGMFDGNGHTISNLTVNLPAVGYVGLFGYNNGRIQNVILENAGIKGKSYVGSITGFNDSGYIQDCTVSLAVLSGTSNTGGLTGQSNGTIEDCTVTIAETGITGTSNVGGLVGTNGGTVTNSDVITGEAGMKGTSNYVGGFVGNNTGTTKNCTVTGKTGITSTSGYVGGFAGINSGTITQSYSTVNVQGTSYVGGFIGRISNGLIEECYATGNVTATGNYVGGFIGEVAGAKAIVRNSFSIGNASNSAVSTAGFIGTVTAGTVENCYTNASHSNGFYIDGKGTVTNCYFNSELSISTKEEGRTILELMNVETFEGWDFENVWVMEENEYPTLRILPKTSFTVTEIRTVEELNAIRNNLLGSYRLMNDIDLSGMEWTPLGTNNAPFSGLFEGNGFIISNLIINDSKTDYNGLFGSNNGIIRNLTLKNVSVTGRNYIGGLVGINERGTIQNCLVSLALLTGNLYTGGLTGKSNGTIEGCTVTIGKSGIIGTSYVGGLVGTNGGTVTNSDVITGEAGMKGTSGYVGGFVGSNTGIVKNCTVNGKTGITSTSSCAGGFAGINSGTITQSYSTVNVQGTSYAGGFTGRATNGLIEECYATGNVTASSNFVGGFIGEIIGANTIVRNSFSIGNVSNSAISTAGFIGTVTNGTVENCYTNASHPNGFHVDGKGIVTNCYFNSELSISTKEEGRITLELMNVETFEGWDFENVWEMEDGRYPTLRRLVKPLKGQ